MKKNVLMLGLLALGLTMTVTSCSDDDDNFEKAANLDYTSENATNWHGYMVRVAHLLKEDASSLYSAWNTSYDGGDAYSLTFTRHNGGEFNSAESCLEQIIDGCCDIANEVGTSKIGEPYDFWKSKRYDEAVYAVESWYSWHSRDDYTNNIYSIRNSYYGTRDGSVAENSLRKLVQKSNAALDTKVNNAIQTAANAIQAIPQPFRNNIASAETESAMDACAQLEDILDKDLRAFVKEAAKTENLDPIVQQYVDVVVLPTYKDLQDANENLYNAITALAASPSDNGFKAACNAWLAAREPWEQSEAFLFGPVDALGLDPNMDSWPLDQVAIVNILKSGKFNIEWTPGDSDEDVEKSQNVRGFHTLEFLLFKDGLPRTVSGN